jgi:phage-related protein
MAAFTYIPDRGYTKSTKPRILLNQFGDGYAQRTRDGINTSISEWNLTFTSRSISEANAILALIESTYGVSYMDWTPPQESVAVKVIASDWSSQYESAISRTVNVKFTQVFDL